jgi:hypothetical protein
LFEPPTIHFSMVPLAWTSSAIVTCGSAQVYAVTVISVVRSTGQSWCASDGLYRRTEEPIAPTATATSHRHALAPIAPTSDLAVFAATPLRR